MQSMTPGHARRIRGKLGVRASGTGRSGRLTNVNCYRRLASPMSYAGNERRGPSSEACLVRQPHFVTFAAFPLVKAVYQLKS